ncbi:MAG: DUF4373 domain-containing protein [Chitinophagaceae bacterium]|nr:DUF4373 domain-containing protein [Chitinophagaceae bacterium]
MKKEAYYFSHDSNAQDDPKCMALIDELGWAGYGLFWALCERMRTQCDFMLPHSIVKALAKRWNVEENILKKVISDFGLFASNDEFFWSERLKRSMELKSEKARESASYRWNNTERNANAMRTHTNGNAVGMRNDAIKGKEKKEKSNTIFPAGKKDRYIDPNATSTGMVY